MKIRTPNPEMRKLWGNNVFVFNILKGCHLEDQIEILSIASESRNLERGSENQMGGSLLQRNKL